MLEKPKNECVNCSQCDDVSDGPEYGGPYFVCQKRPQMSNLKCFPFKTPQKCFEPHWSFSVDWAEVGRKDDLKNHECQSYQKANW